MIKFLLAETLFMSLFHLEYIVKSLTCGIEISAVSNLPFKEHLLPLCSPTSSLSCILGLLASHMLFALYMSDAFFCPDLETIMILFMFHLLACSAFQTILQLASSYSSFKLQLSYYFLDEAFPELAAHTSIPPPTTLAKFLAPLCLLTSFFFTSIQNGIQIMETSCYPMSLELESL